MGRIPPRPPRLGESRSTYQQQEAEWSRAQYRSSAIMLFAARTAFLIFLLIVLIAWAMSGAGG